MPADAPPPCSPPGPPSWPPRSALLGLVIYGAYGLMFSAGSVRRLYDRFQRASEAVFGTIFGALGVAMAMRAARGG